MRVVLFLAALPLVAQTWPQWGRNAQHTGAVDIAGQAPARLLARVRYDPFAQIAQREAGGSLLVHYQPALVDRRDVFLPVKSGEYVSCNFSLPRPQPCGFDAWHLQQWSIRRLRWDDGQLVERWTAASDWKPIPNGGGLGGWEPVFHAALTARSVFVPAAGGGLLELRRNNGRVRRRWQPFGDAKPNHYVVGPITVDAGGNLFYNVIERDPADAWGFFGGDVPGAWLVRISALGEMRTVDYKTLIPDAPRTCRGTFEAATLPWPPSPTAVPASVPCLSQRPGVNIAPAVAPDGTVYVVSRAHHPQASRYSYLIALNPGLTLKWAASLRGHLRDGCGVLLPIGEPGGCRAGTPANGVDPATNEAPAGTVNDLSTSSPVVAPDGSVFYGAFTRYNYLRGHLFHFDANGRFRNAFDFGWDITPAIWSHDGTYSVILKENNYEVGSYCNDTRFCPWRANGPYSITQLDANLKVEWRFANTTREECSRGIDDVVRCLPARKEGGFEWCINAPAVDARGVIYANAEDGHLYAIGQGGVELGRIFLNLAVGAAYTPLSIGHDGRIYTQNDGYLFAIGTGR